MRFLYTPNSGMQLRFLTTRKLKNIKTFDQRYFTYLLLKNVKVQCYIDKGYHSCMIIGAVAAVSNGIQSYLHFFKKNIGQVMRA